VVADGKPVFFLINAVTPGGGLFAGGGIIECQTSASGFLVIDFQPFFDTGCCHPAHDLAVTILHRIVISPFGIVTETVKSAFR